MIMIKAIDKDEVKVTTSKRFSVSVCHFKAMHKRDEIYLHLMIDVTMFENEIQISPRIWNSN